METKSPADLSYQQSEPREVWADQRPAPGWTGPPPAYSEAVPDSVNVNVVHIVTPVLYGDQPVQTVCPHCHAQVMSTSHHHGHWPTCNLMILHQSFIDTSESHYTELYCVLYLSADRDNDLLGHQRHGLAVGGAAVCTGSLAVCPAPTLL